MTRYELLERIGSGGMAEIFRGKAVAAGGFEKPVAIKRILPYLSSDQRFVELLIAEAKILSHLRHRNIVQIFDVGLGDDGQYFLVMEFVDGRDLGSLMASFEQRRSPWAVDLALHIGAEIGEALHQAHSAPGPDGKPMRLVHRDISPSNVLISRSGEVKLTDFGIAKRPDEHTGHGGVRGKFAYISPEQAENRHVDARSDLFALGVVLYELMVGERLFSHLPDFDALRAVRECRVPSPRSRNPRLDPAIDQLLTRVLSRDPALRPSTALELANELRRIRYSAEEGAADPALELASLVAAAAAPPLVLEPELAIASPHEPTVVRIHTAAEFSDADPGSSLLRARRILDRFEEEADTRASFRAPPGDTAGAGHPIAPLQLADSESMTVAAAEGTATQQALLARLQGDGEWRSLLAADRVEPVGAPPPPPGSSPMPAAPSHLGAPPAPMQLVDSGPATIIEHAVSRAATPTIRDSMTERPPMANRRPAPQVAGFDRRGRGGVLIWFVAGAVAIASFFVAKALVGRGSAVASRAADAAPPPIDGAVDGGAVDGGLPVDGAPPVDGATPPEVDRPPVKPKKPSPPPPPKKKVVDAKAGKATVGKTTPRLSDVKAKQSDAKTKGKGKATDAKSKIGPRRTITKKPAPR